MEAASLIADTGPLCLLCFALVSLARGLSLLLISPESPSAFSVLSSVLCPSACCSHLVILRLALRCAPFAPLCLVAEVEVSDLRPLFSW